MKSPEQLLFDEIFKVCLNLGYNTFDYLPEKTSYPFVYIGEIFQQDRRTKSHLYGDVQVTVHIYNDYRKRAETTSMRDNIKLALYNTKKAGPMNISLKNATGQILIDDTTPETLLHGILELDFRFN